MSRAEKEHEILEFWEQHKIFEKSVESRPADKPYVFYDGPPFATGLPHYGHIVASLMKDMVPRYWTMKGYRVERVWGWDCHGLPIENIIEEKLQLKSKKDIEEYGIVAFNEACRATVLQYAEEWKKTIRRIGRWVDMDNAYMTMDVAYMESVWWVFQQLWNSGLIYEGKKAMHVCPRCVTPLSNFEVTLEYRDVKDISATVAFQVRNVEETLGVSGRVSILAWTTTPWTLPGNVLLAVGESIEYALVHLTGDGVDEYIVCAKERLTYYAEKKSDVVWNVVKTIKGADLVGLSYTPLFPYFTDTENAFRVVSADFVSTEDGTGVVHIAPAFGDEDYQVGSREKVGFVQHVTMQGQFTPEVVDFAGMEVKPKDDPLSADIAIIKYLAAAGHLFLKESYAHSYPHCWRCHTPLLNYATSSWFVRVTDLREELLANNAKTEWIPGHMRDGRFGKWLENARDWALSRNRFWGTPLPVWRSEDGDVICVGSVEELEALSGKKITDLHKHIVDEVVITKDGKEYRRIPEVLDCWFESGAMPYGQMHYPFENKEKFERGFPAEFIAEGQDQTRGWFYTLHVLATALTRGKHPAIPKGESVPAFRHVVVNGMVLAEDGKKMSKNLKNYPDPSIVLEQYGADALRFYLASSPVMHAESLNFSESAVREISNKVVGTLSNVYAFYSMFPGERSEILSSDPMDRWILSRLQGLIREVTDNLEAYQLAESVRPIQDFIADLSQWYVRRSRDRFKSEDRDAADTARATLGRVLSALSRVIAPAMPFIAEEIYRGVGGVQESVHLDAWPESDSSLIDTALEGDMETVRSIVEKAHALRADAGIKVRQPLRALAHSAQLSPELNAIIAEEVNVREAIGGEIPSDWITKTDGVLTVALDTKLDGQLIKEGLLRDIVRQINALRKEQGLTINDSVDIHIATDDDEILVVLKEFEEELLRAVLARSIILGAHDTLSELHLGTRSVRVSLMVVSS